MWNVTAVVNGERRQLPTLVIENEESPSLEQVRQAANDLKDSKRFAEYLDRELSLTRGDSLSIGGFDAVQRWSASAEGEANDSEQMRGRLVSLRDAEGALAYFASPQARNLRHPDTVVWHDHSTVLISIPRSVQQFQIEYQPELRDTVRLDWLTSRFQSPAHAVETIFDARSYYGNESAIVDFWRRMRARGHRYVASVRRTADVVVGKVLRRIAKFEPEPLDDPTFHSRLVYMQQRWPGVAKGCPDLGSLSTLQKHDDVMVFIHGTLSCGLQSLKDLCPGTPPLPTYRYEHDTFHRVKTNGEELAQLINTYIKAKRVLLVAHSRGGLVGRVTATALSKRLYPAQVQLLTFGTPHEGTPLANVANGLVNLLLKVGSYVANGIPLMSPLVAAYSLVYNSPSLPPGIGVMQEGSEALDLLNLGPKPGPEVRCWGSKFDADKGASGFGIDVEGVLTGAMGGIDHDLVVPTHSALAYGQPGPILECSHVRYFEQSKVKKAVFTALA